MKIGRIAVSLWAVLILGPLPATAQSASTQQQVASHAQKAAEYLREKRPDLAAPEFQAIVELEPNNVDARANLGVLLFFQGKYAEAIPQMREALKLNPGLPKIQALLGIGEKRTGDLSTAQADLEEAFPKVQDQKIQVETGMELVEVDSAMGDLGKAASVVNVLRQLEPTDETILYTSYRVYSDLAEQSLLSLSVVAPNSARMHQAIAHELAIRGNNAAAVENYQKALKLNPNLPGLHFELAEMLNLSSAPRQSSNTSKRWQSIHSTSRLNAGWRTSRPRMTISRRRKSATCGRLSCGRTTRTRNLGWPRSSWPWGSRKRRSRYSKRRFSSIRPVRSRISG
jgi:Tfp pilus assembly protein PilF